MDSPVEGNKRIAVNTIMLYIRMFIIMIISFFTTKEVLHLLGVEDYGIYNVVGGITLFLAFINNATTLATQRFFNYEIGRGDRDSVRKVYSAGINIHILIALVICIFGETVGLWFLNNYINIPPDKFRAANVVYQLSLLGTMINIIRSPFNAMIIAREKMSFFAYISIAEAVLKLSVVYSLLLFLNDRLEIYALLNCLSIALITLPYYIYCRTMFSDCRYKHIWDKKLYTNMLSFSGWSLLGSVAIIGVYQGTNIIINIFCGVLVNAAVGVAAQVNTAVYNFVANFQTAFNPKIVKLYAAGRVEEFKQFILTTSKYSFLLLWVISLPIMICCKELLSLWLVEVPEHTMNFCLLTIIFSLIDAIQGPLWVSVQAYGKIKHYQIVMSLILISNLPLAYVCLSVFKLPPEYVFVVRILINIVSSTARVLYLRKFFGLKIAAYVKKACMPCLAAVVASMPLPLFVYYNTTGYFQLIMTIMVSLAVSIASVYILGLTKQERNYALSFIKSRIGSSSTDRAGD